MFKSAVAGFIVVLSFGILTVHGPDWMAVSYDGSDTVNTSDRVSYQEVATTTNTPPPAEPVDDRAVVEHVPLPEQVKAIYMSSCVAGTPSFRNDLVELVNETELNSIMIDIKDYSGTLSFAIDSEFWGPAWAATRCGARDMREFIASLHEQDIFVIGRITVFQDEFLAPRRPDLAVLRRDGSVWADHKGIGYIDVAAEEYWDHIVELTVASYNIGFDELNYDYVRYPSDGPMQEAVYPHTAAGPYPNDKPANLEAFFAYLHEQISNPELYASVRHANTGREDAVPYTSADTFGMTTTSYNDLSIGQVQERIAPYVDFVAPMVYPSHYPNGWNGYSNPNLYPYEVVFDAMSGGVARMQATTTPVDGFLHQSVGTSTFQYFTKPAYGPERLRTWIQDFNYGGTYDAAAVRAQIQASYDAGVGSWMLWAPSNRYTRDALKPFYRSD